MQTNLRALILLVASVGTVHAQPRPAKIFALPVYREPRHRLVFENAFVRLLDVRIPPGDTSRYHVHASRQIGVLIENGRTWAQQSGRPAESPDSVAIPIGTVADNARDTLPLTHRVGNGDRVAFHFVVGQLLSPFRHLGVGPLAEEWIALRSRVDGRARVSRATRTGNGHTDAPARSAGDDGAGRRRYRAYAAEHRNEVS